MSEQIEYPRMLYASEGRTRVVASPEEEKAAGSDWSRQPDASHQGVSATLYETQAVVPPSGQDSLVAAVADAVVERLKALGVAPKEAPQPAKPQPAQEKK